MLRRFVVLPAAASLLALSMGGASAATASWTLVPVPEVGGSAPVLTSVSCTATDNCIATGFAGGAAVAESWNGSAWTVMSVPQPAGKIDLQLNGISCASAGDCLAVGQDTSTGTYAEQTLTELWNGSTWAIEPTPLPFPSQRDHHLNAVSCVSADYCVAAGEDQISGDKWYGLIELWNGSSWAVAATVAGARYFTGISCPTTAGCYVTDGAQIAFWGGGSTVTSEPLATPAGGATPLAESISCPSAGFCVTTGIANGASLAESWDGTAWAIQPTRALPNTDYDNLASVSCVSATSCTAVGNAFRSVRSKEALLAERWKGSGTWGLSKVASPSGSNQFFGVSCTTAVNCMAVGTYDDVGLSEVLQPAA